MKEKTQTKTERLLRNAAQRHTSLYMEPAGVSSFDASYYRTHHKVFLEEVRACRARVAIERRESPTRYRAAAACPALP